MFSLVFSCFPLFYMVHFIAAHSVLHFHVLYMLVGTQPLYSYIPYHHGIVKFQNFHVWEKGGTFKAGHTIMY